MVIRFMFDIIRMGSLNEKNARARRLGARVRATRVRFSMINFHQ